MAAEPSPIHGPAHLKDAIYRRRVKYKGRHFDLTGGWMDAGDMTHFTKTTASTASMAWSYAARLDPVERPAPARRPRTWASAGWSRPTRLPDLFVMQMADTRDHEGRLP